MLLTLKQSREALKHFLTNVIELNTEYPIHNSLMQNDCEYIEKLVKITDT